MHTKMRPQREKGRLFIVLPTLEIMLSSCDNSKMKAQIAGMEYSNFLKHCKMQANLRIETYTKCAAAFDMDVLLLHLPKGMIDSLVHSSSDKSHRFFTIEREDLIFLLNELCQVDHKRMFQHIIHLIHLIEKQDNLSELHDLVKAIEELIKKLMRDDREYSLMEEIRSLKESMDRITSFILELKHDYAVLEENIELSTSDVLRLLGISKASLARWREANSVPYRYVSCNHVVYPFKGLYIAIKTGRASFKGFRRLEALQRLNAYKDGVLKGYMGDDSQTLFEEL